MKPIDTRYPRYLFHKGENSQAYLFLGSHYTPTGTTFRVWAPHARAVAVCGDFTDWACDVYPMRRLSPEGIWEIEIADLPLYTAYKYAITTQDGRVLRKADPYAVHAETRPGTASKLYDLHGYVWQDADWQAEKQHKIRLNKPINIYEVHAGSWRRYPDGKPYSYAKLAEELIPYVLDMGYTHIELMPLSEYPLDDSWGYQVGGYFAVTSRYGTPQEFMAFVDACHAAKLGVIMDFVPAHFPKDAFGLYEFDGQPCYEYADAPRREHPEWGTRIFDYGKPEVRSFLSSAAVAWIDRFHLDGLRMDAVASMLYLDYSRRPGEWQPNRFGGRECLEAIDLIRCINTAVKRICPGALLIAEESTAWGKITAPTEAGGLGFDLKWNLGWMHDTLRYMQTDPLYRRTAHDGMTFSMLYAYRERYLLSLSHDEVTQGKPALIEKMQGEYLQKFATLRAYYAFMMVHPGKKLLFMGGEFAQFQEWDFKKELDWLLLQYPIHSGMQHYVRELNRLYRATAALWGNDFSPEGFHWRVVDDADRNVFALERCAGEQRVLCVCNFSGTQQQAYPIPCLPGVYTPLLNSDELQFGGGTKDALLPQTVEGGDCLRLDLPQRTAIIWNHQPIVKELRKDAQKT